jgi:hypothetical protein
MQNNFFFQIKKYTLILILILNLGVEIVCDFWQKFSMTLSDKQLSITDIMNKYGDMLREVIYGLINLAKFEDSLFIELNQIKSKHLKNFDDYKETGNTRKTLKMFFSDMTRFYGFNFFYNSILLPMMTETINEIKKDSSNISAWAMFEVEIFCFESICRNINTNEDLSFLDTIFETIFEIPENLIQIKKTVTNVIDELGNILSLKPNILMKAFNYLLVGLENPLILSKIFYL